MLENVLFVNKKTSLKTSLETSLDFYKNFSKKIALILSLPKKCDKIKAQSKKGVKK